MAINYADKINKSCSCKTLNDVQLEKQLEKEELLKGIYQDIKENRPNLFSSTMVFISKEHLEEMNNLISEIEKVIHRSDYQEKVLKSAPSVSHHNFGPHGVFMGYDFHINETGVHLIEINTNAGGALLNAELAKAQHQCCVEVSWDETLEEAFVEMFRNEWKLQGVMRPLRTIAIIDETPEQQYLYPEFRLFQRLFHDHGFNAVICDPGAVSFSEGKLKYKDLIIDLVYNRLTDFYLENYSHLEKAYLSGQTVFSPNPLHHALYANKANLAVIRESDSSEVLKKGIPETELVKVQDAEDLWKRRKNLFFKPVSGFGSKASYRGDKITKKVWDEILKSDYVAQKIIPPGQRVVDIDGKETELKLDVRAYVYEGRIQLLASRLYAGQTTNFRTMGGGFAPVFVTP
jgi:hypothetical protein